MKRSVLTTGLVFVLGAGCMITHFSQANGGEKKKLLRVGVYDSRGIVMAYVHSDYNDNFMVKTSKLKKEAEAKDDLDTARQLDEQMQRFGLKRHKQGFSMAPVHELIEAVNDKLPAVAAKAGVDVIISKWETDYLAEDADVVDVTLEIAHLFDPKAGTDEAIKKMMRIKPLSGEEIERLEMEHPH